MKHFGTDGIRKKADEFSTEFLAKIIGGLINYAGDNIKIFLAGDTRESTEWILQDLATACETFGLEYSLAGILPTPAINYCFYEMGFDFAIDVTASHNPYEDNGIKIFERGASSGQKLNEKACEVIEKSLENPEFSYTPASITIREDLHSEALKLYKEHLLNYIGKVNLEGLKIALDCANGATSVIGSEIFEELDAKVALINCCKNYNTKINRNCGSTHLNPLKNLVLENHLDLGIAFDGDGDRVLMINSEGDEVDGDDIIAILTNTLKLDKIAVTVMANQGLLNWAKEKNIKTEITSVGDSNVASAMREKNIKLGGEQSGHIILPGEATGDGILTSLMILKAISESKKSLKALADVIKKLPQIILNLPATPEQKANLKTRDSVKNLLLEYSKKLENYDGRLLVRPSGTENLIRLTMWGNDEKIISTLANELKDGLQRSLT